MGTRKKVLYITTSFFPVGQAYATRVVNFARLFSDLGYDVHVIAGQSLDSNMTIDKILEFESYTYEIIGDSSRNYRYLKKTTRTAAALNRSIKNNDILFAIVNVDSTRCYGKVQEICKKNNIKVIRETCEWYDKTSYKLGKFDPRYALMQLYTRRDLYKADGVITISRLLSDHFAKSGNKTIRVPTILDTEVLNFTKKTKNTKIRLMHAGAAVGNDHKEQLKSILLALKSYGEHNPFEFIIYGSDRKAVLNNIGGNEAILDTLGDTVKIMGRIPQQKVHTAYSEADYSIFIRPDRLSSHAGFPTKLAESMVAGTPVIANNTGDIALYLKDRKNGFLLKDSSPEEVAMVLQAIVNIDDKEKQAMRLYARKTAEENFDYRRYSKLMSEFLREVLKR